MDEATIGQAVEVPSTIEGKLKELRARNKQLILDRREALAKLKEYVTIGKEIREEMKTLMAQKKQK